MFDEWLSVCKKVSRTPNERERKFTNWLLPAICRYSPTAGLNMAARFAGTLKFLKAKLKKTKPLDI